ncbi:kinase-like domain-containing protein [Aspergillus avenaceus]|uniref:Kinase-like domain-containing protein n=1 Tax=Aspergillus avenaceus TaxID=36643 RepID=A0A5N6U765_ASPAV|nr:kinase-like domain-containing protein [Aspergillus avenaceus]
MSFLWPTSPAESQPTEEPRVLHSLALRSVTVHGEQVIKSGPDLYGHEASNLKYIAANTTIPVPRVHKVEQGGDGKTKKIYMDYMPGKPLNKAWPEMTEDQKQSVASDLRNYVEQLRNLKGTYIGAANRGQAVIGKFVAHGGGPFDNESQFNQFLFSRILPKVPDTFRYHATKTFKTNHEIVFTHSDLAPRNILVDGGQVTAILDWEFAGWYPEYWEYVKAYSDFNAVPKWLDNVDMFLPRRYTEEIIAMAYLNHFSH